MSDQSSKPEQPGWTTVRLLARFSLDTVTVVLAHRATAGTRLSIPVTIVTGGTTDHVVATISVTSH